MLFTGFSENYYVINILAMKKFYFLFAFCFSGTFLMGQTSINNSTSDQSSPVNPRLIKVEYNPANAGKRNPAELKTIEQPVSEKEASVVSDPSTLKSKEEEQIKQEQPK